MNSHKKLGRLGALAALASAALMLAGCSGGTGAAAGEAASNDFGLKNPGTISVGINGDAKPFTYNEGGKPNGFDIDLLDYVAKDLGLQVTYTSVEFANLLPAVSSGQYDLGAGSISVTEERRKRVDFTDGYFLPVYSIVTKEGAGITDAAGLKGKRVGFTQGSWMDAYATKNYTESELVRFTDNTLAMTGFRNNAVDAVLIDLPLAQEFMENNPKDGLTVAFEIAAEDAPAAFALPKDRTALQKAINESIAKSVEDGKYQEIFKKYFPDQEVADISGLKG
ncbi:transporter substrate-binding domain-containing protein [Pseudarthrobacter sp. fls2-241-R2A-168]|uniref:substrate-binding periplasmic protein n=1 Tax=Pseudarthrobacter sp. fls2-241-R2A-168 TaxID=3040304 RepID=UPI0025532D6D|nr:transporter substrate-binding domain-containing protein [Pseudarthrobacter sp. fls2-241-R2A-168]